MEIQFRGSESDSFTPIDVAQALIKTYVSDIFDMDIREMKERELAEIAEHILIYVKYRNKEE